jgi:phosphate transport system substrate-binding protein
MLELSNRMQQDLRDDFMTEPVEKGSRGCWANKAFARFLLPLGILTLVSSLDASPFDTTRPKWPDLSTNHGPVRSGSTIDEAIRGNIDMLLTDMPMTDAELRHVHDMRGVRLLHIATAVTAVVPCYNLGGLRAPLNFSSEILAGIFLGKITKWNDPAIAAANSTAHLPAADIVVIGHASEDGGTYALTDFLSKTNAEWRRSVGRVRSLVSLPVLARGESPEELAELVKLTPNSMTYLELWAAKGQHLQLGRVKNRSRNYIDPSPLSVAAAAATAGAGIRDSFGVSITDGSGPRDYPIASFTWIVIPDNFGDSEKRDVVVSFLRWVLTEGQKSTESMNLAPLPRSVADRELRVINSVR